MQNPLFEDFLDMDLLGASAESSDLFSYFLNPTENGEMDLTDSAAAHVDSPTMSNASMSSPLDMALPIKFEEDDEAESRKLMLMDVDSCSSDMAMLKSEQGESDIGGMTQDSNVLTVDFGGDALCLTTQVMDPSHLTIKHEATVNPSATIAPAATTISTSAAAATSLNKSKLYFYISLLALSEASFFVSYPCYRLIQLLQYLFAVVGIPIMFEIT